MRLTLSNRPVAKVCRWWEHIGSRTLLLFRWYVYHITMLWMIHILHLYAIWNGNFEKKVNIRWYPEPRELIWMGILQDISSFLCMYAHLFVCLCMFTDWKCTTYMWARILDIQLKLVESYFQGNDEIWCETKEQLRNYSILSITFSLCPSFSFSFSLSLSFQNSERSL